MSNEIVKVDGYDAALAKLKASLPDVFSFEIEEFALRFQSFAEAVKVQSSLRTLEREARVLGYDTIEHFPMNERMSYRYVFRRTTPLPPEPKAITKLARDGVIEI